MAESPSDRMKKIRDLVRQNMGEKPVEEVKSEPVWDETLIPDVESHVKNPELDAFLDGVDILTAYQKWCGKMTPKVGSKRESIMVSCPDPAHPDKNPSAWISLDKQTYYCGACGKGGDKFTIAAFHFGVPQELYQDKAFFPDLKLQMASDLGFSVITSGGISYIEPTVPDAVQDPESEPEPVQEEPQPAPKATPAALAPVVALRESEPISKEGIENLDLAIDWEAILPEGTFLHDWMRAVAIDDIPHEFYFFLGLQALGAALGRSVRLLDDPAVYANLFICLYGTTGTGKSKSIIPQRRLLNEVLPFNKPTTEPATGVYLPGTPGSSEMLLAFFVHELCDGMTNEKTGERSPVNAIVQFSEFSELARRDMKAGSTYRETLMQLYDTYEDVSTLTKGGGEVRASSPFCQVVTTTQPKVIREFLSKTDEHSGFLNRWVVVGGQPRMRPISYGGIEKDLSDPIVSLSRLYGWAAMGKDFVLQDDAYAAWDAHFMKKIVPIREQNEAMLSRFDLLQKKLIVLLTANQMLDQPTAEIVHMVASLHDYLIAVARNFSDNIRETDTDRCWDDVKATIDRLSASSKSAAGVTRREINQRLGKKYSGEDITKAIEGMIRASVLDETKVANRGKPTVRYKLA